MSDSNYLSKITQDARAVLNTSEREAALRHTPFVDVEHVLLGLLDDANQQEPLRSVLGSIDRHATSQSLSAALGVVRENPLAHIKGLTQDAKNLITDAVRYAREMGQSYINSGHLLLAMFDADSDLVREALQNTALNREQVQSGVAGYTPKPEDLPKRNVRVVFERPSEKRRAANPPTITLGGATSTPNMTLWGYVGAGLLGVLGYLAYTDFQAFLAFSVVLGGWIFSLSLHEFSHALVAYWGGDYTVKDKGYLSFNPLRYTHPLLSIFLPVLFLLLGGIALPGGAVYIEFHRLRHKYWRTAVALAGPASNMLFTAVISLPFILGLIDAPLFWQQGALQTDGWAAGLALLVFLQVFAILFNLLPIPGLDGFHAIAPFLPIEWQRTLYNLGFFPILLLIFVIMNTNLFDSFYTTIYEITRFLQIPPELMVDGWDFFHFWN